MDIDSLRKSVRAAMDANELANLDVAKAEEKAGLVTASAESGEMRERTNEIRGIDQLMEAERNALDEAKTRLESLVDVTGGKRYVEEVDTEEHK